MSITAVGFTLLFGTAIVYAVESGPRIVTLAGTGRQGDGPEGDPLGCKMDRLHGIYVDADGAVLIGDTSSHRVRVIRGSNIPPTSDRRPLGATTAPCPPFPRHAVGNVCPHPT